MQWVKSNMAETEAMFRSQQHAIISGNYKLYDKKRGDTHRVVCYMSDGTVGEGLADRLRTILTSFVFAEVHGRPFYLFHDRILNWRNILNRMKSIGESKGKKSISG